jgi:hypothetical protein
MTTETKMDFGIFSNEKKKIEQAYVSIDKQGRVYMNADAQRLFGIEKGKPVDVQLGYKDGAIYMIAPTSKYADLKAKPFRFSGERAYASAKTLIESLSISPKGDAKSEKYMYDESFNEFEGVFAFRREHSQLDLNEVIDESTTESTTESAAPEVATTVEEPIVIEVVKKPKAPRTPKKEKVNA